MYSVNCVNSLLGIYMEWETGSPILLGGGYTYRIVAAMAPPWVVGNTPCMVAGWRRVPTATLILVDHQDPEWSMGSPFIPGHYAWVRLGRWQPQYCVSLIRGGAGCGLGCDTVHRYPRSTYYPISSITCYIGDTLPIGRRYHQFQSIITPKHSLPLVANTSGPTFPRVIPTGPYHIMFGV